MITIRTTYQHRYPNMGHNASSNTATNNFHGTSITIFQLCDDEEDNYIINNENKAKVDTDDLKLSSYYIQSLGPFISKISLVINNASEKYKNYDSIKQCISWLQTTASNESILWVKVYLESLSPADLLTLSFLVFLIGECISSHAIVAHCITVIKKMVPYENLQQVPVINGN